MQVAGEGIRLAESPSGGVGEVSPRAADFRILRRLLLGGAAVTTIGAALSWSIWGWQAGVAVIGFVAANYGLAKALIELELQLIKLFPELLRLRIASARPAKRAFAPLAALGLSVGIGVGALALPMLRGWATGPSAKIDAPRIVSSPQDVAIRWWNVSETEEVRVVVRPVSELSYYVQPCHGTGSPRGGVKCTLEIGGRDDYNRRFEIRVVRLPRESSDKLGKDAAENGYVRYLPEGTQLLVSEEVVRGS